MNIRQIEKLLLARATRERAENEKRYLKSDLEHLGARVPDIRAVATAIYKENSGMGRSDVLELVKELWSAPVHELRMCAVELLVLYRDVLKPSDLNFLERLVRESKTWALVDNLAITVVGSLIESRPELAGKLDRWATDRDFWVRRSAMLALLGPLRRGGGDWLRFVRYADSMLEEDEFFIRKAIGWVLRETAKKRPKLVYEWLEPRAGHVSGVTFREAIKYLPTRQRDSLIKKRASGS